LKVKDNTAAELFCQENDAENLFIPRAQNQLREAPLQTIEDDEEGQSIYYVRERQLT